MFKSGHAKQQGGVSNDLSWDHPTTTFLWASRKCLSSFICQASEKGVCQSLAGPWTCQVLHSWTIIKYLFTHYRLKKEKSTIIIFFTRLIFWQLNSSCGFLSMCEMSRKIPQFNFMRQKISLECNSFQMR